MNKVVHFEIPADDIKRADEFYSQLFGWKIQSVQTSTGEAYHMVHTAKTDKEGMIKELGAINGGLMQKEGSGKHPVIVINVSNINDHLKKISEYGGKTVLIKQKIGDMGFYARFKDPEGNIIGLWEDAKK